MATLTSQLVIELLDKVTSPARRAANALAGISNRISETNGQPITFGDRLDAAMARNGRALEAARGNLVDAVAGFYVLKTAIAGPVQAAMAFEEAMADVRKVVDFPTPEGFAQFQKDLFELSRDVPVAVDGLAQIAAAAGAAGIAGDDLVKFTEAAAKVGVAFEISADDAGDAMAKMMTGLGLTIDETVSLADAMNHLSDAQASSAAEILDVVRRVGAQGKMFGFTAEQTAAFGSAMIASGAQSDVAATSFNNMGKALTRGAAATKGQNEAFKALGLDAEDVAKKMQEDAVGTTVSVLEAIARLPKEQQAAISSQLFGDEARALGPLLTNLDLVRSSMGMVADESQYAGSAFREFENRNKTFSSALQRLRNRLSELSITIGSALLPALDSIVAYIGPMITMIADLAAEYPRLTAAIVGATAAVVAFKMAMAGLAYMGLLGRGGALSAIALGYNTIGRAAIGARTAASEMIRLQTALAAMAGQSLGTLDRLRAGLTGIALAIPGVSALSSAIAAIGAAVATISAPVWGTFAAIAAVVAAAGLLIWKYWDRINAVLSGVGQAIGTALQPALEWMGDKLSFLSPVVDGFGAAWDLVKSGLSGIGGLITSIGDALSVLFTQETLSPEQVAQITERARQVTEGIINWFTGLPSRLLANLAPMIDAGKALIQSLWDGAVAKFGEFIEGVKGIPGRIVEAIGNIDLSNIITWPEPPQWWRDLFGGDQPEPITPAALDALPADQRAATETLTAARSDLNLPTADYLADLEARAAGQREIIAELEADLAASPAWTGVGNLLDRRDEHLEGAREELAAITAEQETARARADELQAALALVGETSVNPEIDTASIDRALERVRRISTELAAINRGATPAAPPVAELDGARAGGGPVSSGGTYLVGERGPELITPNRNGYVNPAGSFGGGPNVEVSINAPITINGASSDPQQLGAEIARQLREQVREAFRGVFADTGMRFA